MKVHQYFLTRANVYWLNYADGLHNWIRKQEYQKPTWGLKSNEVEITVVSKVLSQENTLSSPSDLERKQKESSGYVVR